MDSGENFGHRGDVSGGNRDTTESRYEIDSPNKVEEVRIAPK